MSSYLTYKEAAKIQLRIELVERAKKYYVEAMALRNSAQVLDESGRHVEADHDMLKAMELMAKAEVFMEAAEKIKEIKV